MAPDLAAHLVNVVFCRTVRELSEICFSKSFALR